MLVPLAEPQDVADIWRPLTSDEHARAVGQIRFASAMIRQQVPTVDARLAAGALDADLVRGVIASMVQRVLMNPGRNSEVSIDDMRLKKSESIASGDLYLSATELALLRPTSVAGSASSGAFTIRYPAAPSRGPHGLWQPIT